MTVQELWAAMSAEDLEAMANLNEKCADAARLAGVNRCGYAKRAAQYRAEIERRRRVVVGA